MRKNSTTAIIYQKEKSSVLLIKRRDVPIWALPGGGIEKGESPEEATVREVFEETGLTVVIHRKVALYSPINRLATLTHLFECKMVGGEMKTGSETKEVAFFPLQFLPEPFFYIHGEMIQDSLLQEPRLIKKPLSQITYWNLTKYFFKHPTFVVRFALSQIGLPINCR